MTLTKRVWVNIPYDPDYLALRHAIEVVLWIFGLEPVLAGGETRPDIRLDKLLQMIDTCSFGITEVRGGPRVRSTIPPSYNMPFEHGVMWLLSTLKKSDFHPPILLCNRRLVDGPDIWFSNMRGTDALEHENKPEQLITKLYQWITTDTVVHSVTGVTQEDLIGLTAELIVYVWRATWSMRQNGRPRDELQCLIQDVSVQLRQNGQAVIGSELIAPTRIHASFPSGFPRHEGHTVRLGKRTLNVPFVLYYGLTSRRRSITLNCHWATGSRVHRPSTDIGEFQQTLLKAYRKKHGDCGNNERVSRLERITFHKHKAEVALTCRRLWRWDVVTTNWMLDHPIKHLGSLRQWLRIDEEIVDPAGLASSKLGNTLGVSLVVGNPAKRQLILARRSTAVNHPYPNQITISASGEVRPSEWSKEGPDPVAAVRRLAREQVGLTAAKVGQPKCIGIGRSALDGVPELLFELTTDVPLETLSLRYGGLQSWQHFHPFVVSCGGKFPEVTSWLMQAAFWSPAHLVCCHVYLERHHPDVLA
jgi:hypothetical protein